MQPESMIRVWDLVVRIGHWLLVLAFAVAYLTDEGPLELHEWAGYVVALYLIVRVLWGFIGSEHARFSDFLFSPFKAIAYLVALLRMQAPRFVGHSPAGAMMIFALLFTLAGTVVTGMAELALSHGEGPFALFVEQTPAAQPGDQDEGGEHEESAMMEVHELLSNLSLLLIALHVVGVALASVAHKENLARSMITGMKRRDP